MTMAIVMMASLCKVKSMDMVSKLIQMVISTKEIIEIIKKLDKVHSNTVMEKFTLDNG